MAKRIEFDDLTLDDIRQINNTLLQDLVTVARASDVDFAGAKGKDHVEGGWTRGGDHVKGGWTRGSSIAEPFTPISGAPGIGKKK